MNKRLVASLLTASAFLLGGGEIRIKNNSAAAFLGDSITQYGQNNEAGYVNLTLAVLARNGIKVKPIKAGVSGNKSNQMLARLEKSVLRHKPDFLFVSCGVNDVWHGVRGVPLEEYRKNMTEIVERSRKAGLTVCLMTATMIGENPQAPNNLKLAPYNEFLRQLAAEKKCLLADTNKAMREKLADLKKRFPRARGNLLTRDGVHMNPAGDMMMAACLLKAVGIPEEKIDFDALPCRAAVRLQPLPCTAKVSNLPAAENAAPFETAVEATLLIPLKVYKMLYLETLKAGKPLGTMGASLTFEMKNSKPRPAL